MLKNIFKILAIFIIGVVGGIFADQILWPYFIERPLFYQYELEQLPIYLTEIREIFIQENVALREAIEKIEKVVVGVRTETPAGKILEGSGLVLTSDGLIVTLAELVPRGSDFYFYVDGKWPVYQILKRDLENNLALIKVEDRGLSTAAFADLKKLKLGERVFLVAVTGSDPASLEEPRLFVNEGIVKSFDENLIQTNIFEAPEIAGSPLFNIEGRVVGLSVVDEEGQVFAIPVTKIRAFTGL